MSWRSRILLGILVLAVFGIVAGILLLGGRTRAPEQFSEILSPPGEVPVSGIYLHDLLSDKVLLDEGGSWQNTPFLRIILDSAPEGSTLQKCEFFLYDTGKEEVVAGGERPCNTWIRIPIGESGCSSAGKEMCFLYASATDSLGRKGMWAIASYHVDTETPVVGAVSLEGSAARVEVSDNQGTGACWLFVDGKARSMELSERPCLACTAAASVELSPEDHELFATCADQYSHEREDYLNIGRGEVLKLASSSNAAPVWDQCSVFPVEGTVSTLFSFEGQASDPDGDPLLLRWEFGDGSESADGNPSHRYAEPGVFQPSVSVSDPSGLAASCRLPLIVVEE